MPRGMDYALRAVLNFYTWRSCAMANVSVDTRSGFRSPASVRSSSNIRGVLWIRRMMMLVGGVVMLGWGALGASAEETAEYRDLFTGKDLTGWVNVNTADDTWSVRDGLLVCSGHPIGVMRSDRQYENFLLHIEWRHMEAGGNSGVFAWSEGTVPEGRRLPKGMEIQMLELDWVNQHKMKDGTLPPIAYVHGELFGANGLTATPDNPRGTRSKSVENRCKGKGEWNVYDVVCVDGVIKLSVNGKFVNGMSHSSVKKGYLCLESEGAEIHFRNIRILELPPGTTTPEETAALVAE